MPPSPGRGTMPRAPELGAQSGDPRRAAALRFAPMARLSRRSVVVGAVVTPVLARAASARPSVTPPSSLAVTALGRLTYGLRPGDLEAFARGGADDRRRLTAWVDAQLAPASLPDDACEQVLRSAALTTLDKSLEQLWADHWLGPQATRTSADGGVPDAGTVDGGAGGRLALGEAPDLKRALSGGSVGERRPGDAAAALADLRRNGDGGRGWAEPGLLGARLPDAGPGDAGIARAAPPYDPRHPRDENERRQQPAREVELATWLRAVHSTRQLHEVMVGFWHDHFSVYGREGQIAATFPHFDREVIRRHALGNFRVLLEAVAKSPAMLVSLDNFTSQSGNANENWARELFELHTLGAPHYLGTRPRESVPLHAGTPEGYVDGDVYEAARAFTGWRVDQATGAFQYFEPWHDRFQKIVLGRHLPEYQPPMRDALDVLDLVASHPGTARFVVGKLCQKLLGATPTGLLERATKTFTAASAASDQLAQVVRVIATSDEFAAQARVAVRRPFEATVAMLRATEATFFPSEPFLDLYARAGQRLFAWRTPDGAPIAPERWAGSTPMLERFRLANQLCANTLEGVRVDLLTACPPERTPRAIATAWLGRALGPEVTESTIEVVAQVLAQGRSVDATLPEALLKERLPTAVALVFMTPEFQWR